MSITKPAKDVVDFTSTKRRKPADGILLNESTPFHVREAFKTIRTNLLFTLATKTSKTVVVASAMPNEGKSTTSVNLAMVLAQTGAQVLLMDCDLRKPSVHQFFKLPTNKGLTSILCGIDKIEDALHENVAPNLDVITAGPLSPNPSELLGSTRMSDLLAIVQKAYDYVVLDASPLNIVSDAIIVAKQTAGVLLVIRHGSSRHDQLKKAIESCEFAEVNILGVIFNDSRTVNTNFYGYGHYKYSKDSV